MLIFGIPFILYKLLEKKKDKLQIKHDISTTKFIHNSYIEIARNIFQNPYLFYQKNHVKDM